MSGAASWVRLSMLTGMGSSSFTGDTALAAAQDALFIGLSRP
jgi:hypothetical protein